MIIDLCVVKDRNTQCAVTVGCVRLKANQWISATLSHSAGRKAATVETQRKCDNLTQKSRLKVNCFSQEFSNVFFSLSN